MKKKVIFLVLTLVFCIGCFNLGKLFKSDVLEDEVNELDSVKNLSNLNTLSMMLETEAGSGEYTMETRSSWPTYDDGYVFNEELSKCENGSKLSWNEDTSSVVMKGSISDKCYAYFDVAKPDILLADWIKEQYNNQTTGKETIYLHDSTLENGAGDNSYRYSGSSSSVNNYVCFGSDAITCPDDNLYRIIGAFEGQIKLIKADYTTSDMLGTGNDYYGTYDDDTSYYQGESSNLTNIAGYYWNKVNYNASYSATNYYNDWSYSELNKTHLNKNYIDYLDNINTKWSSMIDTTTWKVGGFSSSNVMAKSIYKNEITNPSTQVTGSYNTKIGLMYVSDYAFAASSSDWSISLDKYNSIIANNWMYMGLSEWTISRGIDFNYFAYYIKGSGQVLDKKVNSDICVRPVFNLKTDVKVIGGNGTKKSPLILS